MAIIYTYPEKTTPSDNDLIVVSDSEDGNKTKQVKISSLPGASGSGVTTLNTLTGGVTLLNDPTTFPNLNINTLGTNQIRFYWTGELATSRGGTGLSSLGSRNQILRVKTDGTGLDYTDSVVYQYVKAGESLVKGDVVYLELVGSSVEAKKADAAQFTKMPAIGLCSEAGLAGQFVNVITSGTLYDFNTSSIVDSSLGAVVYVSTTPGQLTCTPTAGQNKLIHAVGVITKVGTSDGSIEFNNIYYSGNGDDGYILPNLNKGSIFKGDSTNKPNILNLGAANTVLTVNATGDDIGWSPTAASGVTTLSPGTTGLLVNGGSAAASGAVTLSGVLAPANGGTGFNAYPVGSILIAASATSLAALNIDTTGKVLTCGSNGLPQWLDNAVQANGVAGRIQVSGGGGVFSSNANLTFSTATTTFNIGDISNNRGVLAIHGDTSGNAGSIILKASAQSQGGGGVPTTFGGYTVKSPATFPQGAVTNATWNLPQQTPSTAGSILTSGTITGDTTNLTWASKIPVANGGTNLTSNGGTVGKVMKANGTGFAMESRDGSFRTFSNISTTQTITFDYQVNNNLYLSTTGGLQTIELTSLGVNDAGVIVVSFDGTACKYPDLAYLDASGNAGVYVSKGPNGVYAKNTAATENDKIMLTYRKVNADIIVVDFADNLVIQNP